MLTAGAVTTRYEFDPVLDTLTPLVEVYDVDHASMPAWSADPGSIWSADPIGDSWTQTDTYTEGGSTYTVFAQPGTGDLYAFLTSDVGGTTSYSITGKAHIEDQPDVGGQLASGAFDLANYTQVSGGLGYLGVQDFAGTDTLTVKVYYDEDADVATATAEVTQTATITVNEVNDPPTVSGPVTLSAIDEDTASRTWTDEVGK